MRILIYNWRDLAHPKAGGAEVYTDQIARHWVQAGHDITLFCSAVDGTFEQETVDGDQRYAGARSRTERTP